MPLRINGGLIKALDCGAASLRRRRRFLRRDSSIALYSALALGNACRLATPSTQIIELGATHFAAAHHFHRINQRAVHREHTLHALAVGNFADREALIQPLARTANADTLKRLKALA